VLLPPASPLSHSEHRLDQYDYLLAAMSA
jgi:hypothetical protein